MIAKIKRTLYNNRRKVFGITNNLIAGIITGGVISQIYPNFTRVKDCSEFGCYFNIISLNIVLIFVCLFLLYFLGKIVLTKIIVKDDSENYNYKSNFLAGFTASIIASILPFVSKSAYWYVIGIPILAVILSIVVLSWAKTNRSKENNKNGRNK